MLNPEPPDDLAGARFRLRGGTSFRLLVEGSVEEHAAQVLLDVGSAYTTASVGCFDAVPPSAGTVRIPLASGGLAEVPEVMLHAVRIGALRLGSRKVGLDGESRRCELTLGQDVLSAYALEIDPALREVRLQRPRERAFYVEQASRAAEVSDALLLDVTRDPKADWPILTVRLIQPQRSWAAPFVLATREPHSVVSDAAARQAGLTPGVDMLKELGMPGELPGYPLEALELAPGVGVRWTGMVAEARWTNPGAVGLLGADVWGRFRSTLDVRAGVLLLWRPKVVATGERQQCLTAQGPSAQACFSLESFQLPGQPVEVVATVWREVPQGVRLYLEPRAADASPTQLPCRVGLTFDTADRGSSGQYLLPWEGLQKSLPRCAEALHAVASYALGILEEGALAQCPGQCAFVEELDTGRAACECAAQLWGGGTESEHRFLRLYRELMERARLKSQEATEPEP